MGFFFRTTRGTPHPQRAQEQTRRSVQGFRRSLPAAARRSHERVHVTLLERRSSFASPHQDTDMTCWALLSSVLVASTALAQPVHEPFAPTG